MCSRTSPAQRRAWGSGLGVLDVRAMGINLFRGMLDCVVYMVSGASCRKLRTGCKVDVRWMLDAGRWVIHFFYRLSALKLSPFFRCRPVTSRSSSLAYQHAFHQILLSLSPATSMLTAIRMTASTRTPARTSTRRVALTLSFADCLLVHRCSGLKTRRSIAAFSDRLSRFPAIVYFSSLGLTYVNSMFHQSHGWMRRGNEHGERILGT